MVGRGLAIALANHSLDSTLQLMTRLIRWSENQTMKEHFSRLVIERKRNVTCEMNYADRDNGVLSSNYSFQPYNGDSLSTLNFDAVP